MSAMGDSDRSDDEAGSLRRAFEHVKAMREENAMLRQNFENLKALYSECLNEKEQLEGQHAAMQQDMERMGSQYEEQFNRWRLEMETTQRDLEDAKAQIMRPSDVEALRLKITEELEAPHRARCKTLEQEAEKAHQQALEARREAQNVQLDTESQVARSTQALTARQHELETSVREKEAEVRRLMEAAALSEDQAQRCAALERQVAALTSASAELMRENDTIRSEKERAVVEKDNAAIEWERQAHTLRAEAVLQGRQLEALRRKCAHWESESQRAGMDLEAANKRVGELEREHQRASAEAERTIHGLESAVFNLESRLEIAAQEWEEQQSERQAQLDEKEALIAGLETAHRDEIGSLSQKCTKKVQDEEERQRNLRRALEGEAADLRAAISASEESARLSDARYAEQLADVRRELEGARKELCEGELERGGLRAELKKAKEEREELCKEALEARQEAAAACGDSEAVRGRQRETEKVLSETRTEMDSARQKLGRAERQLAELAEVARTEREELEAQLEIEKQHQYEMGQRRGREEAQEAVHREAVKTASLKKKLRQYRKLVAAAAAQSAGLKYGLDDGLYGAHWQARKQVQSKGPFAGDAEAGGASTLNTKWYQTQVDMLRDRQSAFLRP